MKNRQVVVAVKAFCLREHTPLLQTTQQTGSGNVEKFCGCRLVRWGNLQRPQNHGPLDIFQYGIQVDGRNRIGLRRMRDTGTQVDWQMCNVKLNAVARAL